MFVTDDKQLSTGLSTGFPQCYSAAMSAPTLALWFLTLAALAASTCALFVALRTSDRSLLKQLSALLTRSREMEATLDELSAQLKAQRQRENMRAYRARKNGKSEEAEPDLVDQADGRAWVREMNERLARARLGVSK